MRVRPAYTPSREGSSKLAQLPWLGDRLLRDERAPTTPFVQQICLLAPTHAADAGCRASPRACAIQITTPT